MIDNPCDDCGRELNVNTAILEVDHRGKFVILCPKCFWKES